MSFLFLARWVKKLRFPLMHNTWILNQIGTHVSQFFHQAPVHSFVVLIPGISRGSRMFHSAFTILKHAGSPSNIKNPPILLQIHLKLCCGTCLARGVNFLRYLISLDFRAIWLVRVFEWSDEFVSQDILRINRGRDRNPHQTLKPVPIVVSSGVTRLFH